MDRLLQASTTSEKYKSKRQRGLESGCDEVEAEQSNENSAKAKGSTIEVSNGLVSKTGEKVLVQVFALPAVQLTAKGDKNKHRTNLEGGCIVEKQRFLKTLWRMCFSHWKKIPTMSYLLPAPTYSHRCMAKKFAFESLHLCCDDGEIKIAVNEYPALLVWLLTSTNEEAKHFRKYVRLYNNVFAFTSLGGDHKAETKNGIYVFKLHGQIYHNIPSLVPGEKGQQYMQLYFYDGQQELANRVKCFSTLRENILSMLMEITNLNPYARFFRSLREVTISDSTQILLNKTTVPDQRVYNAPTSDEVDVIWAENTSSSDSESPHILVISVNDSLHMIKHYYGCYDPLQYPLLFPYGDCGWTQGLKKMSMGGIQQLQSQTDPVSSCSIHTTEELLDEEARRANGGSSKADKHISAREYYAYRLQCRSRNYLLRAGRCFQQYIVEMYVKGLLDTIDCAEECAANVGRRVILLATFIGGPRDLKKRYLNTMSLVQRFGKPDLFITMTCNPNWPEIKQELAIVEEAQNRPNIVSRVFRAKTLDDFDKFVCAETPSSENEYLREIVIKHMMHGPCGHLNPECPCMKHKEQRGRCKYGYPKKNCEEIKSNGVGYHMYRRRATCDIVKVRGVEMDNSWVIPYNPYLLAYFNCHLNVEVCSTIEVVKYLYKYVYKGHDKISFNIVQTKDGVPVHDEIKQYQSGRWVSPCEAMWRLFGFDLYEMYPPVLPLPIHLPNSQLIQMRPHENLTAIVSDDKRTRTCLTEFFKMNCKLALGTRWLYNEFSEHYRSPKSFQDLRIVNGYVYDTFEQVALKLGLMEDDDAVELCLTEGCAIQMPHVIRKLLATFLIFCQPSNPLSLWLKYYDSFSKDFRHKHPTDAGRVKQLTIRSVEQFVESMGKIRSMNNIVLPTATSGIAAANIPSGRAAHSRFKIPLDPLGSLACNVPKQGSLAKLIRETMLIIWDEASMAKKENIESLDSLLRDICSSSELFGGKIVVFGGDFRQVLLVVPRKTQREAITASLVTSALWPQLLKFRLTENLRAKDDPTKAAFLLALGNGELQNTEDAFVELPPEIVKSCYNREADNIHLTVVAFPEMDMLPFSSDIFTTRAILTPMNEDVDVINSSLICEFPAVVRNLDAQWRAREDDLPFHLSLGSKTVIRSLDPEGETIYPRYQTLASNPSIPVDDDRDYILVIVLYASEEPRRIVTAANKETSIRDLMVIYHRTTLTFNVSDGTGSLELIAFT
ncbi:uncharacterized protein LOC110686798 [Chenopodium quinoa]|uniref:uncharacterized protein LOC110686798 n=1 Tax=Chenopodium quinoa TaxID=63459 RepID=UPI000B78FB23|nr:uncharacterized protein LOC110686798 [Chenopodium quinoa]